MSRGKEIALKIKADIDKKLGPTFKAMAGGADDLGQALGKLERRQRQLNKVAKLDETAKQAQKNYEEAAKHYDKLRKLRIRGTEEEKAKTRQDRAAAKARMMTLQKEATEQTKVFEKYKVSLQKLKIPLDNYQKELKETSGEVQKLTLKQKALEKVNKFKAGVKKRTGAIGRKVASSAKTAIVGGTALATLATFDSGRNFIEFNQQMKRVQAISRSSEKDFQILEKAALNFGATTAFTSKQAGEGMEYLALAGFKTNQILEAMPGLLSLAAASGEDLGLISDIVSDNISAFKLQAKDAEHFANVMAAASSSTNTNVAMLGEAFKYAAAPAAALGGTVEEVSAILGVMADNGIKASQAGTTLRSAYLRLAKPSKSVQESLNSLGITLTDENGKFIGLTNVIQQLQEKFKGLTDVQQASHATTLFGQEAVSGMLSVINTAPGKIESLTESFKNSEGVAKKMADTMLEGPAGSITLLTSAIDGLKTTLGKRIFNPTVLSGIKKFTEHISGLTSALNNDYSSDSSKMFKAILSEASNFIARLQEALGPGVEALKNLFPSDIKGVEVIKSLMDTLIKVAKIVSNVIVALTPLVQFFINLVDMIGLDNILVFIGAFMAIGKVVGVISAVTSAITAFISIVQMLGFIPSILALLGALKAAFFALGGPVVWIGALFAATAYMIYKHWDYLKEMFLTLGEVLKEVFINIKNKILEFPGILGVLLGPIGLVIAAGIELYKNWDTISDKLTGAIDKAGKALSKFKEYMKLPEPPSWMKKLVAKISFQEEVPDGSHRGGLANVPFDGYRAILHKGERVLTAEENREFNTGDLTARVRRLQSESPYLTTSGSDTKIVIEDKREININGAQNTPTEEIIRQLLDSDRESIVAAVIAELGKRREDSERTTYGAII